MKIRDSHVARIYNPTTDKFVESRHWRVSEEVLPKKGVDPQESAAAQPKEREVEEREVFVSLMRKGDSLYNVPDPESWSEAISGAYAEDWKRAAAEELGSLRANQTWKLIPRGEVPKTAKILGSRMILKVKRNSDGSAQRFKARLVARGFAQRQGIDYEEVFAPTVDFSSVRILLTIAAREDLEVQQADVKTAYLNASLREEIFMLQPRGLEEPGKADHVCLLQKSLYGLKQAGREWHNKLSHDLGVEGFEKLRTESCIFRKDQCLVAIYVDDMLIVGSHEDVETTKEALSKLYDIKHLGAARDFLGIRIERDRERREIYLSQEDYIEKLTYTYGLKGCRPLSTPASIEPSMKENSMEMTTKPFQELTGSLLYLSTRTRPDISFAVGMIARKMSNYRLGDFEKARRILRYLAGTREKVMKLGGVSKTDTNGGGSSGDVEKGQIGYQVTGYSDASWASHEDSRSTSGSVIMIEGSPVVYRSWKQRSVAQSTAEAEYQALGDMLTTHRWVQEFIVETGRAVGVPSVAYTDNMSCLRWATTEDSRMSRHVSVKLQYARERCTSEEVALTYLGTDKMIADLLTKPLTKERTNILRSGLGVVDRTSSAV